MSDGSQYADRIVIDPKIMAGKPVVKGTRIPVELVLKRLSQDLSIDALIQAYPRLTPEDIKACLAYAEHQIAGEDIFVAIASSLRRRKPPAGIRHLYFW